jgi:large subunit ribosomal protein L18
MKYKNKKTQKRTRLKAKIRSRVFGSATMPRLSVFKSNRFIYAQIIDDEKRITLAAASDMNVAKGTKTERAKAVGKTVAVAGAGKGITKVVFDRNGFKYTGRVRALADEARASGLIF